MERLAGDQAQAQGLRRARVSRSGVRASSSPKRNLLSAVWPDTFVGDAVLKVTIRQIREALADDPKSPRFIETAHRRGYRFIGQIAASGRRRPSSSSIGRRRLQLPPAGILRGFVGRDDALSRMHGWLEKMRGGERQIVFVTGEAGIGKTTLVDTFARSIAVRSERPDRQRAVPGTVRDGRGLPAGPRSDAGGCAASTAAGRRRAARARADVAAADAFAGERRRIASR